MSFAVKRIYFFFLLTVVFLQTNSQSPWQELKTDIINAYSTTEIYALSKNTAGTIVYAAIGNNVLKWDGNGWIKLGNSVNTFNSAITTLATDAAGNVYAAGFFYNAGNFAYVAKWNGNAWSELGTGSSALNANGVINSIAIDPSGNVYAAGSFNNAVGKKYVAKWNGTTWSELGGLGALSANDFIWSIATDLSGNVYAGGNFSNAGGKRYVAKWNGSAWSELGGVNALNATGNILCVATDAAGNVYTGGQFMNASNREYVAKWNGAAWSELGTGANSLNAINWIDCITPDNAGNIYAGGVFSNSSGNKYVAKWNGTTWSEVGAGPTALNANHRVSSIVLAGQYLYAAGDFQNSSGSRYVAKWTNSNNTWAEAGVGGTGVLNANSVIYCLAKGLNGIIYAAGTFSPNVSQWNGSIWSAVVSNTSALNANGHITTMITDPSGNLYVAGEFTNGILSTIGKNYVAKWNGSTWSELGGLNALNANDDILDLEIDAQGNIYAAGRFTNAAGKYYVAKWNGTSWSELGTGANALNANDVILDLAVDPSGNVYAGGKFTMGSSFTNYLAKWNGTTWSALNGTNPLEADQIMQIVAVSENLIYLSGWHVFPGNDGVDPIAKWDGTSWSRIPGSPIFTNPGHFDAMIINSAGDLYMAGTHGTGYGQQVFKLSGTTWSEIDTAPYGLNASNNGIEALMFDNTGTLYAAGYFTNSNDKCYVAAYSPLALSPPLIQNVSNKCTNSATAKGKLGNPPSNGSVAITLDGTPVTYAAADSSFTYFTNGVTSLGNHTVRVIYSNSAYTRQKDSVYSVSVISAPTITITAATTLIAGQSSTLTASITNGGSTPAYQWQDSINASGWRNIAGATNSSIIYLPALTGHRVRCMLNSTATCANLASVTSSSVTFTITIPTALNPVPANQFGIRLFPNPVTSLLVIDTLKLTDQWQELEIQGIDGRQKIMKHIDNQSILTQSVQSLVQGLYVAILRRKNGQAVYLKFVKL